MRNRINQPTDSVLPRSNGPGNEHRNNRTIEEPQPAPPPSAALDNRHIVWKHCSNLSEKLFAQSHRPASEVYRLELVGLAISDQIVCPAQAAKAVSVCRGRWDIG